jgi:hypothetical protein
MMGQSGQNSTGIINLRTEGLPSGVMPGRGQACGQQLREVYSDDIFRRTDRPLSWLL